MKNIGLSLLILSVLVGCNDSKKNDSTDKNAKKEIQVTKVASAENFKKVINRYVTEDCIYMRTNKFPVAIEKENRYSKEVEKYKTFEKLGFTKSNGEIEEKITQSRTKIKTKYILTEKGKKYYKTDIGILNTDVGFCVATQEVDEITNFTAPKDFMGVTLSKVKFTLKTKEEPFVKDINKSIFTGSFGHNVFEYKKSDSKELILTEMKGWISSREFKSK